MRIQIIGPSGSGKSTLGKYLADQLNVAWIDTDKYLWKDDRFTVNYPVEERLQMIEEDLAKHKDYIVSGSVFSYSKKGFFNKELTVFLVIDESIRQKRLYDREIQRYGESAFDLVDEVGKPTNDFIEWTKTYYMKSSESLPGTFAMYQKELSLLKTPYIEIDGNLPLEEKSQKIIAYYKTIYQD